MKRALAIAVVAAACVASPMFGSAAASLPGAVVILGNAVGDGYGSDPAHPYHDAPGNSWATGTNPAVGSIYSRILAKNPTIRGHNVDLAHHDASIDDLAAQAQTAVGLTPKPDLVLIEVEGDIRCDGNDDGRVTDFRTKVSKVLDTLTASLPRAKVFVTSAWGSFPSYVKYLNGLNLGARLKHAGKSSCQLVESPSGRVVPSHVDYIKRYVDAYDTQLASACKAAPHCRYDRGAAQELPVTAADISLDQDHLTVAGQAKLAAIEWAAMTGLLGGH
jgi:hypothetical protein